MEEVDGVGGASGDGGRGAALFQIREDEGAAEISEIEAATGSTFVRGCARVSVDQKR